MAGRVTLDAIFASRASSCNSSIADVPVSLPSRSLDLMRDSAFVMDLSSVADESRGEPSVPGEDIMSPTLGVFKLEISEFMMPTFSAEDCP
jgi:hypothetical protein